MIQGIHHITAIASDAQDNVDFYTNILGLRLVKKTVNQDDTGTYHLFYGDTYGQPGMDLTFFIFKPAVQGKRGNGLVTRISFAVPEVSLAFWEKRFEEFKVKHEKIKNVFEKKKLIFYDGDDQQLELVGIPDKDLQDMTHVWTKVIDIKHAVRSFYSASLQVQDKRLVEPILTQVFGYKEINHDENIFMYELAESKRAHRIEIQEYPMEIFGRNAAGTVHHIAFRARDEKHQAELRQKVIELGIQTTEVIDRFYFKSVYFRIPAGILFEIATDSPGFTADENIEHLGEKLALPPFLENKRKMIEEHLPPLKTK